MNFENTSTKTFFKYCIVPSILYLLFLFDFKYAINVLATVTWFTGVLFVIGGVLVAWAVNDLNKKRAEEPGFENTSNWFQMWADKTESMPAWQMLISVCMSLTNWLLLFTHEFYWTLAVSIVISTISYTLVGLANHRRQKYLLDALYD